MFRISELRENSTFECGLNQEAPAAGTEVTVAWSQWPENWREVDVLLERVRVVEGETAGVEDVWI